PREGRLARLRGHRPRERRRGGPTLRVHARAGYHLVSIERRAARGGAWDMAAGVGTRVVGLVGTLVLTRFIAPADYGEVSAAAVCVLSANQLLVFAFGN